jgi:hypothetical protein
MPITQADRDIAERIAQHLAETYQVAVVKDWGKGEPEGELAAWRGGEWSLDELDILQKGVADLAAAMGGPHKFFQNLGAMRILQQAMKYRGLAYRGALKFTASPISIDPWTVVHELSHAWDANYGWQLSRALERYTGGYTNFVAMVLKKWRGEFDAESRLPGCNRYGYFYGDKPPAGSDQNFNRKEDFAESVAAYVYPELVQPRVDCFKDDERYRQALYYPDYRQTRRWAFVNGLIHGTITVG